jgi:uncharacterized protein
MPTLQSKSESCLRAMLLSFSFCLWVGAALAASPSFECGKVKPGSIEEMICRDEALSALDRRLSEVYAAASGKAAKESRGKGSVQEFRNFSCILDRNEKIILRYGQEASY